MSHRVDRAWLCCLCQYHLDGEYPLHLDRRPAAGRHRRLRRIRWEVLLALFCVIPVLLVLLYPGMYDGFFIFLVWTSALNSALAGIGIADYFFLRRQRLDMAGLMRRSRKAPTGLSAVSTRSGCSPCGRVCGLCLGLQPANAGQRGRVQIPDRVDPVLSCCGDGPLRADQDLCNRQGLGRLPERVAGLIEGEGPRAPSHPTPPHISSDVGARTTPDTFDYIIIGAGSAGCVLANRLSEDPAESVLVLEFGGSDRSIFIQMPTALSIPMNGTKYNWRYETVPEPGLDGRRVHCPRGKVLGGSSSINGLVYMRGHARDFDEWETLGARGWGYADCLPYFQKAESWAMAAIPIAATMVPWPPTPATR